MEMELRKRVRKLNHRLDIMQSTYDLLRAHIEHKDSILLEQTIIVLIALEIIFTVIQYVCALSTNFLGVVTWIMLLINILNIWGISLLDHWSFEFKCGSKLTVAGSRSHWW